MYGLSIREKKEAYARTQADDAREAERVDLTHAERVALWFATYGGRSADAVDGAICIACQNARKHVDACHTYADCEYLGGWDYAVGMSDPAGNITGGCSVTARSMLRHGAYSDAADDCRLMVIAPQDMKEFDCELLSPYRYRRETVETVDDGRQWRENCACWRGNWYTAAYFNDNFAFCRHCDNWYPVEDMIELDDGWYCEECAREVEEEELIDCYHSSHGRGYDPRGEAPYIGFELEVEAGGYSRADGARLVTDIAGDAVHLEEDSSLERGFEIVSEPHSTEELDAFPLEDICRGLSAQGYHSHDGGRCGFHLHYGLEWFGATRETQERGAARLVRFFAVHWDALKRLSRREKVSYCAADSLDELPRDARALVKEKKDGTRYTAVNLQNMDTIGTVEIRLGRGSLNAASLRAWIDLCTAAVRAAGRGEPVGDFRRWIEGIEPATVEYMERRGVSAEGRIE